MDKTIFVNVRLAPLCRAINKDISEMEYFECKDSFTPEGSTQHLLGGDEYVKVMFKNGYVKYINVSASSLKGMTQDVLKKI